MMTYLGHSVLKEENITYRESRAEVSNRQVTKKNSNLLQEALEPHYIHEVGGKD